MDKTHGDELKLNFNVLLVKELENWIKSMYLIPEEFEFQRKKIYNRVKEQILQETGW
jgi:hypothetical protein